MMIHSTTYSNSTQRTRIIATVLLTSNLVLAAALAIVAITASIHDVQAISDPDQRSYGDPDERG